MPIMKSCVDAVSKLLLVADTQQQVANSRRVLHASGLQR